MTTEDFLNILGIKDNELVLMEIPKLLKNKDNKPHKNCYSTGKVSTKIGDILRSQRIDLAKWM